jgi:hypothetical protein
MGPREAAYAIPLPGVRPRDSHALRYVSHSCGTPEALRDLTQDILGMEIHALKPGETLEESEGAATS